MLLNTIINLANVWVSQYELTMGSIKCKPIHFISCAKHKLQFHSLFNQNDIFMT
jgi:hypothetical protein